MTTNLLNENSTTECHLCPMTKTDSFLQQVSINPGDLWRNVGILWAYIIFNIFGAIALYWLIRVPKSGLKKQKKEKKEEKSTINTGSGASGGT